MLGALECGGSYGAGLEVLGGEPNRDPRFYALGNGAIQLNQGFGTLQIRVEMGQVRRDDISGFLSRGRPLIPINRGQAGGVNPKKRRATTDTQGMHNPCTCHPTYRAGVNAARGGPSPPIRPP